MCTSEYIQPVAKHFKKPTPMIKRIIHFAFIVLLLTPAYLKSQYSDTVLKIEYDWSCSFCASLGFHSTLYSNENGSVFTFKEKTNNGNEITIIDTSTKFIIYKFKSDSIFEKTSMNSISPNGILIGEKRQPIDWVLIDSIKVIDKRRCKFASGSFRGRKYSAWYDPEVQSKTGPWKLHGLPGAIILAYDSTNQLRYKAISISIIPQYKITDVFKIPSLTIVPRLEYRKRREERREKIYDQIENLKPKEGSAVTYEIEVKINYLEFY
ncbi:MAG: GLPGLI family protein [Patiriisocius sp.]|jgi:GLPGLI family protein